MSTLFLLRGPKASGKTTLAKALSEKLDAVHIDGEELATSTISFGPMQKDTDRAFADMVAREAMRHIKKGRSVVIDRNMSLECTNTVLGRLEEKNVPVELCDVLGAEYFAQSPEQHTFEKHPHALFIDTEHTPVDKAVKSMIVASDVAHPVHGHIFDNAQILSPEELKKIEAQVGENGDIDEAFLGF